MHETRRGVFEDENWECCDGFPLVMVRLHKMMSNTKHKCYNADYPWSLSRNNIYAFHDGLQR